MGKTKMQTKCEERGKLIKAMAHPTRLFLIEQLSKQEKCVCALTEMVGVDISTISKHLAILKSAGIVEDEKRGLQVCYRLRRNCVKDFFNCIDKMVALNRSGRK